jgi:peptide deformylase
MQILTLGSELLRQKAAKIEKIDGEMEKTVSLMLEALKKDKGVGLAGPQIGFMKRVFITQIEGDGGRVFINPSIIETSQETAKAEEGCLSIPGVYADVARAKSIKVQAWNEKGRPFTLEAAGLMARVIQHEYDHLEGVLFLDRLPEEERNRLLSKYEKKAQKSQKKAKPKE